MKPETNNNYKGLNKSKLKFLYIGGKMSELLIQTRKKENTERIDIRNQSNYNFLRNYSNLL